MTTKMKQFPAKNPNPVLCVSKDGLVLFSNEAGEPLLHVWGANIGEKPPSYIRDFVKKVISQNIPEKMEVKVRKKTYMIEFHPVPEEVCVHVYGFDISDQKEIEARLFEAYEEMQTQSEELQTQSEELQMQSEELQTSNVKLQAQSDELHEAYMLLHKKENEFRTLSENSPDLIGRFDRQNNCLYANPAFMRFYYAPPIAEFYGWSATELFDKTQVKLQIDPKLVKLFEKQIADVFVNGEPEGLVLHYTSSQGKVYYFDTKVVPESVDSKVNSVLVISRDITAIKESEAKQKDTLDNLDNLVKERTEELEKAYNFLEEVEMVRKKEIHHRIKNNLQVISSLLDLQAEKFNNKECIKDSEVMEAFKESQDRVVSMVLIHEELYKGKGFDTLNFSSYLKKLANNLFLTYRLENPNISLNMNLDEDIFFDMDTAIPLGIIVNEIISNSLKYAFLGRDKGEINIKLSGGETRKYIDSTKESKNEGCKSTTFTLSISDNGVGIPKDLDIENLDSLGLQLVTTLVDQLDGELELKREKGSEFTVRFTVTERNSQEPVASNPHLVDND